MVSIQSTPAATAKPATVNHTVKSGTTVNVNKYSGTNITFTDNGNGANTYDLNLSQYKQGSAPQVINFVDNSKHKKGEKDIVNVTLPPDKFLHPTGKKEGEYIIVGFSGLKEMTINFKGIEVLNGIKPNTGLNQSSTIKCTKDFIFNAILKP